MVILYLSKKSSIFFKNYKLEELREHFFFFMEPFFLPVPFKKTFFECQRDASGSLVLVESVVLMIIMLLIHMVHCFCDQVL